MDARDITNQIRHGSWSIDEIDDFLLACRHARAQLGRDTMRQLRPGITVRFTSNRNGQTYSGTVVETKLKNVIVQTAQGRYRVPASMLELA